MQPIMAIWINSEALLLLLKQDPDVARLAALYLRWSLLGLPAYTFNAISRWVHYFLTVFTSPLIYHYLAVTSNLKVSIFLSRQD